MTLEAIAATLGLSLIKKKKSRIEPYVRTLALADIEYNNAAIELVKATNQLADITLTEALNKRDSNDPTKV